MKKAINLLALASTVFVLACSTHIHTIGKGAQGGSETSQRQWYVLWGLVPLNDVKSHEMAGNATDYEIKTQATGTDVLINIFTQYVTVVSRTVTVKK